MKQADKLGRKNKIGAIGEKIAASYINGLGYNVCDVNYLKKWGEIDIVARETVKSANNTQIMHFIEVKTVSHETKSDLKAAVARGTWRPEENVHFSKIQRLNRAIESWIGENNYTGDWQIDIIAVRVVTREKRATVKYLPNIIFD